MRKTRPPPFETTECLGLGEQAQLCCGHRPNLTLLQLSLHSSCLPATESLPRQQLTCTKAYCMSCTLLGVSHMLTRLILTANYFILKMRKLRLWDTQWPPCAIWPLPLSATQPGMIPSPVHSSNVPNSHSCGLQLSSLFLALSSSFSARLRCHLFREAFSDYLGCQIKYRTSS